MKRLLLFFPLLFLMVSSCDFKSDDLVLDETTEKYQLYDYYVDENGNEGIVAFVSDYRIIVISADESYESWGPMGVLVYQSDSISVDILRNERFGLSVLQAMDAYGIDRFPAQAWCYAKNKNEEYPYTGSWRLPSYYELKLIFHYNGISLDELNEALYNIGGTLIGEDEMLWTCVEDFEGYISINNSTNDYDKVNRAVITSPMQQSYSDKDRWIKKQKHHVRAIKYIYSSY